MGFGGTSDREVWQLARDNGCAIVTKNGDFHRWRQILGRATEDRLGQAWQFHQPLSLPACCERGLPTPTKVAGMVEGLTVVSG